MKKNIRYRSPQYGIMFDSKTEEDQKNIYQKGLDDIKIQIYDALNYNSKDLKFYVNENKEIILQMNSASLPLKSREKIGNAQEILTQRIQKINPMIGDERLEGKKEFNFIEINTKLKANILVPKFKELSSTLLKKKKKEILRDIYQNKLKPQITDLSACDHQKEYMIEKKSKRKFNKSY